MSRACSPGGRFTSDLETQEINKAIDVDLKRPVGTNALWYLYNEAATVVDPIYDTGDNYPLYTDGKRWDGPFNVPIVRALITQGQTKTSQQGFYNSDLLHLTIN